MTTISSEQLSTIEPLTAEHDEIGTRWTASVDGTVIAEGTVLPQHFLAGIDDDVEQDLAAIGIALTPDVERSMENAHRQAMAAVLFRRIQRITAGLSETQRTMDLELAMVRAHYERQMVPGREKVKSLLGFIQILAELTPWGKKRSHETPYGTFGVKKKPASVALADESATLGWARAERPECVRVAITLSLTEALQYFTSAEIEKQKVSLEWGKLKATLEDAHTLPPGVVRTQERDEAFAKPANILPEIDR